MQIGVSLEEVREDTRFAAPIGGGNDSRTHPLAENRHDMRPRASEAQTENKLGFESSKPGAMLSHETQ
jgi:hypothetical protein